MSLPAMATILSTNAHNYTNTSATASSIDSAGSAITSGYHGDSVTIRVLIAFFPALAMYNALELLILIFFTFTKYEGVYFWSLLTASSGIIPYSLGFLFKFNNIMDGDIRWFSIVLITIGWYTMVTGQSFVLWSRLHLIVQGEKGQRTLRWTLWMICINAVILHIPTTILTFGSNGELHTNTFARAYSIMEKIQMSGFFLQEVILSAIYIGATVQILNAANAVRDGTRRIMWQLLGINVLIIIMDLALLGLEAASLYLLETIIKGVFYSIKLKLEFAILGKLVQFVGKPGALSANMERTRKASITFMSTDLGDNRSGRSSPNNRHSFTSVDGVPDFIDMSRIRTDVTHATFDEGRSHQDGRVSSINQRDFAIFDSSDKKREPSVRLPPGLTPTDVDLAFFEHTDQSTLPVDQERAQSNQLNTVSSDNSAALRRPTLQNG